MQDCLLIHGETAGKEIIPPPYRHLNSVRTVEHLRQVNEVAKSLESNFIIRINGSS